MEEEEDKRHEGRVGEKGFFPLYDIWRCSILFPTVDPPLSFVVITHLEGMRIMRMMTIMTMVDDDERMMGCYDGR